MKIKNLKLKINLKGFTLIELLIVITILGILAGITMVSYGGTQERSRDSRRKTDLDAIKKALELAKQDTAGAYYYPNCDSGASCALDDTSTNPDLAPATNPYIKKVPLDPKTGTGYTYITFDADGTTACSGTNGCITYKLKACLENKNDSQKDTTNTCTSPLVSYTITPN
jgi:type II secretion system protein G